MSLVTLLVTLGLHLKIEAGCQENQFYDEMELSV